MDQQIEIPEMPEMPVDVCDDFKAHPELYKKIEDLAVDIANDNPGLKSLVFGPCFKEQDLREEIHNLSLKHFVLDGQLCIGISPRYQYDPIYMYRFNAKDKNLSNLSRGKAFGLWGSGIRQTTLCLKDITRKCVTKTILEKYYDRAVSIYNEIITVGIIDHD